MDRAELTEELAHRHGRIEVDAERAERRGSRDVMEELQAQPTNVAVEVMDKRHNLRTVRGEGLLH
eukprot:5909215-Amphidinium_carterae.1